MVHATSPLRLFVAFVAVVHLVDRSYLAEAFWFFGERCGENPTNNYPYNLTVAKRLMAYSASAYVYNNELVKTWNCSLCNDHLAGFQPSAMVHETRHKLFAYMGYEQDLNANVLVFRGTQSTGDFTAFLRNWILNARIGLVKPKVLGGSRPIPGKVHSGMYAGYKNMQGRVLSHLRTLKAAHPGAKLFVTGHSLGAGLATLATVDIYGKGIYEDPIMINFGSPRVGSDCFAQYFSRVITRSIRVAHSQDVVTWVPPGWFGYRHVSGLVTDRSSQDHRIYLGYRGIEARRRRRRRSQKDVRSQDFRSAVLEDSAGEAGLVRESADQPWTSETVDKDFFKQYLSRRSSERPAAAGKTQLG
eukprot:scpid73748/ scgid22133/ Mono- and diacylglycerol lipase; Mono- and diacylglycerol lipase